MASMPHHPNALPPDWSTMETTCYHASTMPLCPLWHHTYWHHMTPPSTATLATPYQNPEGDTIILHLPILPWYNGSAAPKTTDSSDTDSDDDLIVANPILDHLMTSPTPWEGKQWHWITCHTQYDDFNQTILAALPVLACSNMAVDVAKFSTFSWILYSDQALWQGKELSWDW